MTEEEKMLKGLIYDPNDPLLAKERRTAHELCLRYNSLLESQEEERKEILKVLFPDSWETLYLQGPIQFDYGVYTKFGKNVYANFHFTVLDVCPVTIGDNVFFGPNVSIFPPMHPFLAEDRNMYEKEPGVWTDQEYGRPIVIEKNCWIAGNVTICGGVTIHEGCVIGAGSVVTHDIPAHSLAAGNPCRVIRPLTEKDSLKNHPELFVK